MLYKKLFLHPRAELFEVILVRVTAIVAAAGESKRFGRDKLLARLGGKPLIAHALQAFQENPFISEIVLVASKKNLSAFKKIVSSHNISKAKKIVLGGETRQHSVFNGLKQASSPEVVVVHNGANPLVSQREINEAIKTAIEHGAAVVGAPARDTIKEASEGIALRTLDRKKLYVVQTPQAIKYDLALKAFEKAFEKNFIGTDDTQLLELLGHNARIIECSPENIKVTTQIDFLIAEALLEEKSGRKRK